MHSIDLSVIARTRRVRGNLSFRRRDCFAMLAMTILYIGLWVRICRGFLQFLRKSAIEDAAAQTFLRSASLLNLISSCLSITRTLSKKLLIGSVNPESVLSASVYLYSFNRLSTSVFVALSLSFSFSPVLPSAA